MTIIKLSEAKAKLSEFAKLAENGESTIVMKHHKPSFMIAPLPDEYRPKKKRLGLLKGKIDIADDFDEPSQEILDLFYNNNLQ